MSDAGRTTQECDPTETVLEYFARMRAGDIAAVDLFHDDARLVGLGQVREGKATIREFYSETMASAGPVPEIVEDPLVSGSRVAVEIRIALAGGASVHVIDLFVVEEGRIRSLSYFVETH